MNDSLPWPRGSPPKFKDVVPKYQEPHWKTTAVVKCASCGAFGPCIHKNKWSVAMNNKWQEGKEHRPGFMLEGSQWRKQLDKVQESTGKLKNGQPLPPGTRHGWGSFPGKDALVGSPRRYGEWRLVYVPTTKEEPTPASDAHHPPRSRSELSHRSAKAEAEVYRMQYGEIQSHRNRQVSPQLGPYSTVQNMDFHTAVAATKMDNARAWHNYGCTTPDLVRELNDTFPGVTARSVRPPKDELKPRQPERRRVQQPVTATSRAREEVGMSARSGKAGSAVSEWMDKTTRERRVKMLLDEMPERLRTNMEGRQFPSVAEEVADTDDGNLAIPHFRERKAGEALESFYWMQSRKAKKKKKLKGERAFRW